MAWRSGSPTPLFRAGLESHLCRQRPDHRGRGHRHRDAGPVTTTTPARCAISSRTTCSQLLTLACAMEARPVNFSAGRGPQNEKVKVLHAIPPRPPRRRGRPPPSTARATVRRRKRSRAYLARGRAVARGLLHRDVRRAGFCTCKNWRWAGVAVLPANGLRRWPRKVTENRP